MWYCSYTVGVSKLFIHSYNNLLYSPTASFYSKGQSLSKFLNDSADNHIDNLLKLWPDKQ